MYSSIVVGSDGSATARVAVNEAGALADLCDAELHVVCAYQAPSALAAATLAGPVGSAAEQWDLSARETVEAGLEQVAGPLRSMGVKVSTYAVPGDPVTALLSVAESTASNLIVLGSKGMAGARRVLGSVPNSVAHKASCAVLIVKTC